MTRSVIRHCPSGKLCQETGVEFKARLGRKRPQADSDEGEEGEDGRQEDNLDDLYPRMSSPHHILYYYI